MKTLPLKTCSEHEPSLFFEDEPTDLPPIPPCLFLAGFDPQLLGYDRAAHPFVPPALHDTIFARGGIVRAAILLHYEAYGWRTRVGKRRLLHATKPLTPAARTLLLDAATKAFPDMKPAFAQARWLTLTCLQC